MAIIQPKGTNEEGRQVLSLTNPANGEFLYDIECQTAEDVNAVIEKAHLAQPAWAALSVTQRVEYMMRLREQILDQQDRIIDVVIKETGKPMQDALTFEIYAVCAFISYWCKQASKTLKEETFRASGIMGLMKKVHMQYCPLGVVGVIAPWNGPFVLTANPTIQALLAGNTVVAKGSEITPICSKILEDLCRDAGFPEGVCQVLIGDGSTGAALTSSPMIDKVAFTGSVATGKKVAESCLQNLTPYSLELGGKDAMIICADADLDKAAHGAVWGGCVNTGHFCCGIERIYVEAPVYDAFVEKVTKIAAALRQGQQFGVDEDLGAVFWDRQMSIIEDHVNDAIARGAKPMTGGKRVGDGKGLYFPATVLVDVDESSDLMQKETFGPVLPIIKVVNEEEAIAKANDSNYGLHGSVWTQDKLKGLRIARRIQTGSMAVNDIGMMYGVPNAPFGGVKESGMGSINGQNGLRGYTHPKPIIVGRYAGMDSGYPHDQKKYDQMKKLMNFMWKSTIGRLLLGP
ncbi:Putative succinate-semialdehyde dehydrogenase [NADP(+)] 2 [BD1-7 clade bacterium]|uniref:Aldehyde dehydrogenase n=1 Tax=BD1-7 clade bacterium TaxID=2029982 RepID=A0A5S9PPZ4_9GAMM|nr:Putative succinate-semialdehyde dehydrogenase [NADP(+)] 2 [BD1-7 clade bacterium]